MITQIIHLEASIGINAFLSLQDSELAIYTAQFTKFVSHFPFQNFFGYKHMYLQHKQKIWLEILYSTPRWLMFPGSKSRLCAIVWDLLIISQKLFLIWYNKMHLNSCNYSGGHIGLNLFPHGRSAQGLCITYIPHSSRILNFIQLHLKILKLNLSNSW